MEKLDIKQVIVVPNHLRPKLRAGKLSSQCCHASMASFLHGKEITQDPNSPFYTLKLKMDSYRHWWITNAFAKVVLKCENEEELLSIYGKCLRNPSIPHALIKDEGRTVFSEPTITCLGIGPLPDSMLAPLTGHLKLY